MTTTYYVCHGPNAVHYVELDSGSNMSSGQPNIEQFDNEGRAVAQPLNLDMSSPLRKRRVIDE